MFKGKYFKHKARKRVWQYIILDRIRKNPCSRCPKKLKLILKGDCDYVPMNEGMICTIDKPVSLKFSCVYKWAPVERKIRYKWECKLDDL